MDIFDGLRVVARWWFIVLPILVVSFASALVFTTSIQPEFSAEASVLLVGPSVREGDSAELEAVNPILVQPSSLTTAAEVAALTANTVQVRTLLGSEGLSTTYTVAAQRSNPIIIVETLASSRDLAIATAIRVVEIIAEDLRIRQDAVDAPADQRVTTTIIGVSAVGGADYGGRNRARIALFVVGIGLAVGAAFLKEALAGRSQLKEAPAGRSQRESPLDLDEATEPSSDEPSSDEPSSDEPSSGSASASDGARVEEEREPVRRR